MAQIIRKDIINIIAAALVMISNAAIAAEDQNLKNEKIDFAKQAVNENTLSGHMITPQISPYQLFAGTVIPGVLITGMNSDLPGTVIGQVSQNVYDTKEGKYLLIPQGTKIIGIYDTRTAYAQTRGHVLWQRLVFPNGDSIILDNMAGADQAGFVGFKDKVRSHYARVIWSAVLGGAITGGVAALTDNNSDDSSFQSEAGAEAGRNISNATNSIVQKNLNIAPTVIINPGYKFNIIVDKDLILKPYLE